MEVARMNQRPKDSSPLPSTPDAYDDAHAANTHSFIASRAAVIHAVTEDYTIMSWDRCLGLVWKKETTVAGMQAYTQVYREVSLRYPSGIYLLTVVEEDAPMPPFEAREAVAVFLRNGAGRIRMSAVVHEGAGFRAAAVRSVVTGISMLSKAPFPHRIFATVEQASKWLGTTQYRDVDPDYTVFAVNEARGRAAVEMMQAHEQ